MTGKQEAFCTAYLETGNASEAYRRAYSTTTMRPETVHRSAFAVLEHPNVSARIAELRRPVIEAAQVTLGTHLTRLHDLSLKAEQDGQFSAAIAAEIARGKASGVHVEKTDQTVTLAQPPVIQFIRDAGPAQ